MDARLLIGLASVIALATPVAATAKPAPIEHPGVQIAKHVVKHHVAPRQLCICTTTQPGTVASEVELEARVDADLIAQGLDPVYASFQTTSDLQKQYDATLITAGLRPLFAAASGPSTRPELS